MWVVHLGRLKAPREAAEQMDLLTVPSHDGADLMVKQAEEALSASSRDRQGPIDTSKADWSQMAGRERETHHGDMPNPRQVPSEGQRSPSRTNALCKGFETMMT
jgi:hypothetical protein